MKPSALLCSSVFRPLAHTTATDLEWKVIYVGSAEDTRYDQVLEEVDVGPIPIGVNKFVLTAGAKDKIVDRYWGSWVGWGEHDGGKSARGRERGPPSFRNTRAAAIFSSRFPGKFDFRAMPLVWNVRVS